MDPLITNLPDCSDVTSRLRRVLSAAELDCRCRPKLDEVLARFSALEQRRQLRDGLGEVRRRRDWIVAQLSLLVEIDEITERELDSSVMTELALLFDEIASQASNAAHRLRETGGLLDRNRTVGSR